MSRCLLSFLNMKVRDKNRKSSSLVSQLIFSPYIFSPFLYNVRDVHNHSVFTMSIIKAVKYQCGAGGWGRIGTGGLCYTGKCKVFTLLWANPWSVTVAERLVKLNPVWPQYSVVLWDLWNFTLCSWAQIRSRLCLTEDILCYVSLCSHNNRGNLQDKGHFRESCESHKSCF